MKTIKIKLAELRAVYGSYKLTDEDYHEEQWIADLFDIDFMFWYWRNLLDKEEKQKLFKAVRISKLLLSNLIMLGETILENKIIEEFVDENWELIDTYRDAKHNLGRHEFVANDEYLYSMAQRFAQ